MAGRSGRAFDAIADQVPVDFYQRQDPEGGSAGASGNGGDAVEDVRPLAPPEEPLSERLTPNTRLGWLMLFAAAVLAVIGATYAWPLVPPVLKSFQAAMVALFVASNAATWLYTRHQMLTYWQQFDLVADYRGSAVKPLVGNVCDSVGKDRLVQVLESVGFAGLRPTFKTVDEEFSRETPLQSKIDRQDADGTWDTAKGKLDHAYLADAGSDVFDNVFVAHSSGQIEKPRAPDWEWETEPPETPDMDAARALQERDHLLRTQVVPSLRERLQTKDDRLEKLQKDVLDKPVYTADDLEEMFEMVGLLRPRNNGQRVQPEPQPEPSYDGVDEAAREAVEGSRDS